MFTGVKRLCRGETLLNSRPMLIKELVDCRGKHAMNGLWTL